MVSKNLAIFVGHFVIISAVAGRPMKEKLHNLQNRDDFLRIFGEQRRKRGEREAQVKREGRSAFLALLPSRVTRFAFTSLLPLFAKNTQKFHGVNSLLKRKLFRVPNFLSISFAFVARV